MYYNSISVTPQQTPILVQQKNEQLTYINQNNNTNTNNYSTVYIPSAPVQVPLKSQTSPIQENNNSLKLFNDPIFYSVLLGCTSFIITVFINLLNSYNFWYLSTNGFALGFSLIGCLLSPLIISKIKPKFSIIIGIIIIFVCFIIRGSNPLVFTIFASIGALAFQLALTSIFYLLSLVNLDSQYKNILFALYFFIQYGLSISIQYIYIYNFNKFDVYMPLVILAIIFVIILSKPDNCINSTRKTISDIIPNPKVFQNEKSSDSMLLITPTIVFIGFCSYGFFPFSYLTAAITVLSVGLLLNRCNRLTICKILMICGLISAALGLSLAIKNNFSSYLFNYYSSSALYIATSVFYSIFSSGTMLIIYSMSDEMFPRHKLLSGISTIRCLTSIGVLASFLFSMGQVIYTIGWFAIVIFSIPTFILFYKSLSNLNK